MVENPLKRRVAGLWLCSQGFDLFFLTCYPALTAIEFLSTIVLDFPKNDQQRAFLTFSCKSIWVHVALQR
jgi:hypothetical protein